LVLLGQSYLQKGDSLAARDAIERALVLAPDYRKAQELLQPAATRPP
jgi:Tfp pilus assembly protein PilF